MAVVLPEPRYETSLSDPVIVGAHWYLILRKESEGFEARHLSAHHSRSLEWPLIQSFECYLDKELKTSAMTAIETCGDVRFFIHVSVYTPFTSTGTRLGDIPVRGGWPKWI